MNRCLLVKITGKRTANHVYKVFGGMVKMPA